MAALKTAWKTRICWKIEVHLRPRTIMSDKRFSPLVDSTFGEAMVSDGGEDRIIFCENCEINADFARVSRKKGISINE